MVYMSLDGYEGSQDLCCQSKLWSSSLNLNKTHHWCPKQERHSCSKHSLCHVFSSDWTHVLALHAGKQLYSLFCQHFCLVPFVDGDKDKFHANTVVTLKVMWSRTQFSSHVIWCTLFEIGQVQSFILNWVQYYTLSWLCILSVLEEA